MIDSYNNLKAVVVVCGTAFVMAEVREELGIIEPRDSDILRDAFSNSSNGSTAQNQEQNDYLDAQESFGDAYTDRSVDK